MNRKSPSQALSSRPIKFVLSCCHPPTADWPTRRLCTSTDDDDDDDDDDVLFIPITGIAWSN